MIYAGTLKWWAVLLPPGQADRSICCFVAMSCGMAKGDHVPEEGTRRSIMQVIGDQDKSFHGSLMKR